MSIWHVLFGKPKKAKRKTRKRRYKGLGDVVKASTSAVGIRPCDACKRRAAWLNRKIPF